LSFLLGAQTDIIGKIGAPAQAVIQWKQLKMLEKIDETFKSHIKSGSRLIL
jgi:hypothetical protein